MEVSGRKDLHLETRLACQPCQTEGDSVPAEGYCENCTEYFCSTCLAVHNKQSATKKHVIKLKDEMPKECVQTGQCSELCDIHKTEIVKYFCDDHDEVACGVCIILRHKACNVQLVSDASDDYDIIEELIEVKCRTEQILNEFRSCKHEIQDNITAITEMYSKAIREMKHFRTEINRYLDKMEDEIQKEIETSKLQDISFHIKLQDECLSMEKDIEQFREGLDKNADNINNLFVTAKLAQKRLQIAQELTKHIVSESGIISYMFVPSRDFLTLTANNSPFGTLSRQRRESTTAMNVNAVNINAQAAREGKCFITGLAKISCDELFLADSRNKSLKILNVRENEITSTHTLCTEPWDVTLINEEIVAATLPDEGKILFINTKHGLSESSSLKVRKNCQGIDHHNDLLAVSFCTSPAVQILTMTGDVLCEVLDTSAFGFPAHLVWNKANASIYVSDYWQNSVYELKMNGDLQVKATVECREWRRPRGLAVAKNGMVAVCCEGNDEMLDVIVPDTREIMPFTLKYLKKPVSILICEEQSKVYISSHFSAEECNVIKSFDMKFE